MHRVPCHVAFDLKGDVLSDQRRPRRRHFAFGLDGTLRWRLHGAARSLVGAALVVWMSHAASDSEASERLFLAVMTQDADEARAALSAGAQVNWRNGAHMTPLTVACAGVGPPALVELLLEHGADPSIHDASGWTPLMYASSGGQIALVDLLLKSGRAQVNAHTSCDARWSALTRAAHRGHAPVVDVLLRAGAEASHRSAGKSPWELAEAAEHHHVLAVLGSAALERPADHPRPHLHPPLTTTAPPPATPDDSVRS